MRKHSIIYGFLFAFAIILLGINFMSPKGSEVFASDNASSTFKVEALDIGAYTETDGDIIARTAPKPSTASDYKDWIFAGWYTDQACTRTVSKTTKNGTYYAKFVPAEVLSAKCQVSAETDGQSDTSKLRIISTVDSLKYSQVGFELVFKDKTIPYSTNKVFSKIEAATDGVAYGFSPNIFDLQSEYFITATLINIKNEDFDAGILIKPYWVTKDGTKVYGVSRYARVEDSYLGIVNVPVRLYSDSSAVSGTATVTYDASKFEYLDTYTSSIIGGSSSTSGYDCGYVFDNVNVSNNVEDKNGTLTVSASSNANVKADGMLVNLRLKKKADASLPKKNEFTVGTSLKDASSNAVAIVAPNVVYMNYVIGTYSGVADTSWYDSSKSTFVITTAEELFGFASLVNDEKITDQTVCLGADIIVNRGWTASAQEPTYTWTKIGSSSVDFVGTFDGQGHSISGIYINEVDSTGFVGLFAYASGEIKNFSLENSYIASDGNMIGSIAGFLTGNMSGVSSSAIVENTAKSLKDKDYLDKECGGLVGRFGSGHERTILNCQFSGSVTSSNRELGGIVGRIAMGKKTIAHCLNTGTVHTKMIEGAWAGGLVGSVHPQVQGNGTLILKDCLNSGDVTREQQVALIGAGIGYIRDNQNPQVTIEDTYATKESCVTTTGIGLGTVTSGNIELCSEEELSGYMGYLTANLDFYTEHNKKNGGYWVVNADSTPTLLSFSDVWADMGWYFEDDDITTYEIGTVEELYGLAVLSQDFNFEGETIKVTADITINEGDAKTWGTVTPKNIWSPIGTASLPFAGTFDGDGHTISGMYVYNSTDSLAYAGLFGNIDGATIQNLRLENSYVETAGSWTGGVVGCGKGTMDTVYCDAIVEGSHNTGGIVGTFREGESTMNNCWFAGSVNKNHTGYYVGGIVGKVDSNGSLTITNCLNTGSVKGTEDVGGILGWLTGTGALRLSNCMNVGSVTTSKNQGGILGCKSGTATIMNSYEIGTDNIIGNSTTIDSTCVTYASTDVTGEDAFVMQGLDFAEYWVAKTGATPELKSFSSGETLVAPNTQVYTGWYNGWDTEYEISSTAGLYGLSTLSVSNHFSGKKIVLTDDIMLNEGTLDPKGKSADWQSVYSKWNTWTPIGRTTPFAGTFDGQGHTISGVYVNITTDGNADAGLFGQISGATIQNLRLENSYIYAPTYYVGGIAGRGSGTLDTIYCNAIVQADISVFGGIIGASKGETTANNCWFDGYVGPFEAAETAGGIIGNVDATTVIKNCLNTGMISGTNRLGGIVGRVSKNITLMASSNVNAGSVTATKNLDANHIVGLNGGTSKIVNSYGLNKNIQIASGGTLLEANNDTYDATNVQGNDAYIMQGLDFVEYWVVKEGATPELKSFSSGDTIKVPDTQAYTGWYNNWDTEYKISNAADLRGLSILSVSNNFSGKKIILTDDIVLNEGTLDPKATIADWEKVYKNWNTWTPIGRTTPFAGTFDGQGYTISGVYVNMTLNNENALVGLFGELKNATIQRLRLDNSYIYANTYFIGGIAGRGSGTLDTIYCNAIVQGDVSVVGGLVGTFNAPSTVNNCWFAGSVNKAFKGEEIGGIVGMSNVQTGITNCLVTGTVAGYRHVGGVVGRVRTGTLTITNCLSTEKAILDGVSPTNVGGILGTNVTDDATKVVIKNSYCNERNVLVAEGAITNENSGTCSREGLLGATAMTTVPLLFEGDTAYTCVVDDVPALKSFVQEAVITADTSWYNVNKKTFTIKNAAELYGFAKLSQTIDFKGKTIKLGADITMNVGEAADWSEEAPINQWIPIDYFAGTFDGQGHSISGIYVKSSEKVGLFGIIHGATIKDLQLKNCYVHATGSWAGSIVGLSIGGTFDTLYSDAIVQGDVSVVGGLIGDVEGTVLVDDAWFDGSVNPNGSLQDAGGILGRVNGDAHLTDCLNTGTVKSNSHFGGIVGRVATGTSLDISSSLNTGSLEGGSNKGAILGNNMGAAKIANCYYTNDYSLVGAGTITNETNNSTVSKDNVLGASAFAMTGLDFTDDWAATTGTTPVLRSFASQEGLETTPEDYAYVGWYNTWDDEYTISTVAGLRSWNTIGNSCRWFEGKTVKLGADIVINEGTLDPKGTADEWQKVYEDWTKWSPLTNLKGVFDGQGHSISGLYIEYTTTGAALFRDTNVISTIRNLKLVNSYIAGPEGYAHVGSIAGWGYGTLESVYSNAIVVGRGDNVGGLVGTTKNGTTTKMSNCWFDGAIISSKSSVGGLLGFVNDQTTFTLENCLFTGTITNTATSANDVGGLCGNIYSTSTLHITKCLIAGSMSVDSDAKTGKVVGNCAGKVDLTGVYSLVNAYPDAGTGNAQGTVVPCSQEDLLGDAAKDNAPLLFENGTYWMTVDNDLPILGDSPIYEVEDSTDTLMNVPLSRYRIVISESATTLTELLAEYLQKNISDKTGVTLEIVNDSADATSYEIVLGNTVRDISSELYNDGKYTSDEYSYSIKSINSSIQIGYSDSPALVDAFDELLEAISHDNITSFDLKHSYDTTDIEKAEASYVRVMSSNIYTRKDTTFNHMIPYKARAELLGEIYLRYKPDFIGWQEADQDMLHEVYKYIASEYTMIEYQLSEHSWGPLFYRTDAYEVVEAECRVLDSTHNLEWAVFSAKGQSDQKFIVMNLHFNVDLEIALSQALIVNKTIKWLMKEYPGVPVAVMGDYNSTVNEARYKTVVRGIEDELQSGATLIASEDSDKPTCHRLSEQLLVPTTKYPHIDHVAVTSNLVNVMKYKVIHDMFACWASDHYPIFVDVSVK